VERYSAAPYLATLLNCMLWMLYGLPAVQPHSLAIIVISATGMATQLAYIAVFLAFSTGSVRRRLTLLLVAVVAFVGLVAVLVLSLAHTHGTRAMIVGVIMVVFGTGLYASPLTVMVSKI
jgi:solute carrier family 50 protein (sugar transporter)